MLCSSCGRENDPDARFCQQCGAPLTQAEILTARESGGPFLCSVHTAEALPADEDELEL